MRVQAVQGKMEDIPAETPVFRIVFFTEDKENGDLLVALLKKEYPSFHVTKSWFNMVEVMSPKTRSHSATTTMMKKCSGPSAMEFSWQTARKI